MMNSFRLFGIVSHCFVLFHVSQRSTLQYRSARLELTPCMEL